MIDAVQPPTPHALTAVQTEVLLPLLRHDLPGHDVLRDQVPHATVTRYWWNPSASFDLAVADGVPTSDLRDGDRADEEWGWTPDGEPEGNLIVWVEAGRLAGVEDAVALPQAGRRRRSLRAAR